MIQETTWRSIRCVHRTEKSPAFWEELPHCGGFELGEKAAAVYHSEMADETVEIDFLRPNSKAGSLLKVEARGTGQVPGCKKMLETASNVFGCPPHDFGNKVRLEAGICKSCVVLSPAPISGLISNAGHPLLKLLL